jgi:AcrR family transcriptional regulator
MRYPKGHKDKTRQRIVTAAARLFRRHGYAGVGIDEIMAAADLTRGGFYGYFRSKSDLFAAVMQVEHDFNRRMGERPGESVRELGESALDVVSGYLDPRNRKSVGRGCAMASLYQSPGSRICARVIVRARRR